LPDGHVLELGLPARFREVGAEANLTVEVGREANLTVEVGRGFKCTAVSIGWR